MGGANHAESTIVTKGRLGPIDIWKIHPKGGSKCRKLYLGSQQKSLYSYGFIIGGANQLQGEGTIVTKGRLGPIDILKIDPKGGRWYILETNYDHWTPPPASDDRRDPAIKAMNAMGQKDINKQSLLKVMSTPPVMNKKTTYTVVMSASQPDIMEAWIRDPKAFT